MITVGMDIHKAYSFVTVLDSRGKVCEQKKLCHERKDLEDFFNRFPKPPQVAIESCWNWQWIQEILEKKGCSVHLSHPLKTKAIASARIKTDKVDSKILAQLLRYDLLPTSYIATREERLLRETLRHRVHLVQSRTQLVNRVKAIFAQNGIAPPCKTIFSKKGKTFLRSIELPDLQRMRLDQLIQHHAFLEDQILEIDNTVDKEAAKDPRVPMLTAIPGIGNYTAMMILAEIGSIKRFPSAGHLSSYFGLAPSVHQSGTIRYTGHITKQGSRYARYVLIPAARHAARGPYKATFNKIKTKKGAAIAYVAIARKLTVAIYHVLTTGKEFRPH